MLKISDIKVLLLSVIASLMLSGCSSLTQQPEPDILLMGVKPAKSQGLAPEFIVSLKVVNPSREPIKIDGISCKLYLQGHKLAVGVAEGIAAVPAYGEGMIDLKTSGNLLGGIGFFYDMVNSSPGSLTYNVDVSMDVEGRLFPVVVETSGQFDLRQRK